jgi:hypothetical protein
MNHTPCVAIGLSLLSQPLWAADGGFFEDSKASLSARNYYFSRDFSDIVGANQQSKAEEWAQGFILDFKSGYTRARSALAWMPWACSASSLDSSPDRVNTGLLPVHGDGRAAASTAAWLRPSRHGCRRPSCASANCSPTCRC